LLNSSPYATAIPLSGHFSNARTFWGAEKFSPILVNPQKENQRLRASSSGFYPFFVIHIPLVSPTPHTRCDSFSSHLTRRTHRLSSFPSSSFILVVLALRHDIRFSRTRPRHGVYSPRSHSSSSYTYSSRSCSFGVYPFFVIHTRRARLHPSRSSSPRRPHRLFLLRSSLPRNVLATESFVCSRHGAYSPRRTRTCHGVVRISIRRARPRLTTTFVLVVLVLVVRCPRCPRLRHAISQTVFPLLQALLPFFEHENFLLCRPFFTRPRQPRFSPFRRFRTPSLLVR